MSCDLLVGSTGFVGGNLLAKHTFAAACHSSDISAQYGTRPDLCVYAGVPAAMFLANADPEADLAVMRAARENIRQIAPKRLVLISSIAVLADSRGVYEDSPAQDTESLPAYGKPSAIGALGAGGLPRRAHCAPARTVRRRHQEKLPL